MTEQEVLLEKYEKYLKYKAQYYSNRGLDYDDLFNQGYLFLLECYQKNPAIIHEKLISKVSNKLRTYYNRYVREKEIILYGLDPEDSDVGIDPISKLMWKKSFRFIL